MDEKLKVEIILYSVYRIREDNLQERKYDRQRGEFVIPFEELDEDYDFPLIAEMSGKIVLEENIDNKNMIDILYYKNLRTKVPLLVGSIFRKSFIQYVKVFE